MEEKCSIHPIDVVFKSNGNPAGYRDFNSNSQPRLGLVVFLASRPGASSVGTAGPSLRWAPLAKHRHLRHRCHRFQVASSIAILPRRQVSTICRLVVGVALMNFQASEVQGLGPIWAKDIWPFFSSTIFSSLNHLFSFLCKAFSTDRWAVLQEIGTHLVTFFGLYLKLLQTPELFRPNHISAIFDLGVELGYQLDLLGSQHRITHDLPGWVAQNVEFTAALFSATPPLYLSGLGSGP